MCKLIEQTPIEIYDDFIAYLELRKLSYKKVKDFTPIGKWCLVEVCAETYSILDEVEEYVNNLIRRLNYGWIVPEFTKNNF